MSARIVKRRRARKACIPCRQRKRKCDTEYPCGMCTRYEYTCRYAEDEDVAGTADSGAHAPTPAKQAELNGGADIASRRGAARRHPGDRSHVERGPREAEADGSSTNSPTIVTSVPTAATTPAGIFDEQKFRYTGASAAMAFPHVLGVALGSHSPPKIHSFAYNFGIRPEEAFSSHGLLGNLISEGDLELFSGVYFSILAPIGDLLDAGIYAQRCRDYYHGSARSMVAFGAVAAGIAALGSFLSASRHPQEPELIQYAKAILDDPASMRLLGVDHIIAWGLRMLYLRATTRPGNAWIASCTTIHLCEVVGLHEEESIKKMASVPGATAIGHDAGRLRRIFWIAWAGHNLMSYEYDRSAVQLRAVTCEAIVPMEGSVADQFVQLAQIIPAPNSPFRLEYQPLTPTDELCERLKALDKLNFPHPFLVVTKADVAFCFYRRMFQLKMGIPDDIINLVIGIGNAALEAAAQLASQGRLFWNVIGSVFQYICILLAIDTPAASAHVASAFKGLDNLVKTADTGLTREAMSMAQYLLSLSTAKRRRELAQLEAVEASYQTDPSRAEPDANTALPDIFWAMDWDQFLIEPYLSMHSSNVQL